MINNIVEIIKYKDSASLAELAKKTNHEEQHEKLDDRANDIVNWLFERLKLIFPASINTIFKDESHEILTKRQWIIAFKEQGVHKSEHLRSGLRGARASSNPFFPAVGQFIHWCKVSNYSRHGIMSAEDLFDDVMEYINTRSNYDDSDSYPWRNDIHSYAVRKIHRKIRSESLTESFTLTECERVIKSITKILDSGGTIPQIGQRMIEDTGIPSDRESALSAINKLKKQLAKRTNPTIKNAESE